MKIVCDKCHAKYAISDDKLKKGKILKIKCKKCGNIIIVRPPAEEEDEDEATKVVDYSSMQDQLGIAVEEKVWYLLVGDSEEGPFSEKEVKDKITSGEVDGDVFAWKEGLADWKKLRELDPFSSMFGDEEPAESALASSGGGAASESLFSRQSLFDDQDEEEEAPKMKGQRHEDSVLFNLSNLQALTTSAEPDISAPKPGYITPSSEGSGLIDIRALSAALEAKQKQEEQKEDDLDIPAAPVLAQPVVAPVLTPAQPAAPTGPLAAGGAPAGGEQKKNWALIGGIAGAVVVLAIVGFFAFGGSKEEPKKEANKVLLVDKTKPGQPAGEPSMKEPSKPAAAVAEKKEEAKEEKKAEEPSAKEEAKEEDKKEEAKVASAKEEAKEESKGSKEEAKGSKGSGSAKKSSSRRSRPSISRPSRPTRVASSRPSRPKPTPSASSSDSGSSGGCSKMWCLLKDNKPACCAKYRGGGASASSGGGCSSNPNPTLTAALARSGVARVKGKVRACGSKYQIHGRVKVRITVGCDGRVKAVSVVGKHAGTPLASCIQRAVRRARFPKFRSPSRKTFTYPFFL